jgi:hypothetical protein
VSPHAGARDLSEILKAVAGANPEERVVWPGFPAIPGLSTFPETNVRTYLVDTHGLDGLWFLSLDNFFDIYRNLDQDSETQRDGYEGAAAAQRVLRSCSGITAIKASRCNTPEYSWATPPLLGSGPRSSPEYATSLTGTRPGDLTRGCGKSGTRSA